MDDRQSERDGIAELIAAAEAEHGPVTEAEVQAVRERLRRAREEQGTAAGAPTVIAV